MGSLPISSSFLDFIGPTLLEEEELPVPTKMAALVSKGRWQHLHTARIYLDTSLQALAATTLPSAFQRPFKLPLGIFL